MGWYRFYCTAGGRIERGETHECDDDVAARSVAAALLLLHANRICEAVEVWDHDRKVTTVRRRDLQA